MIIKPDKNAIRVKRHYRVRNKVAGTAERPRLNVFRSARHIYCQIIDDVAGNTLVSASTMDAEVKAALSGKSKKEAAKLVGETAAKRALNAGIKEVVFDRGGYLYTGRVAELAAGARSGGLDF